MKEGGIQMQYGVQVDTYKKTKERSQASKLLNNPFLLIIMMVTGILISRVIFYLNTENIVGIAPFGVAFLLSVIIKNNLQITLGTSIGICIGYLSISNNINCKYVNLVIVGILSVYGILMARLDKRIKDTILYFMVALSYLLYGVLVNGYDYGVAVTIAFVNSAIIIPIYYVVRYGIRCIEDFNTNYFFSSEEIISIGLIICLAVSGIGDFNIFSLEIRNIIAYIIVLAMAFTGGANYGTAIGVAMGIVVGVSSGNMMENICAYSTAGLISGIFKDTGRFFSFLSYVVMYFAIAIYSKDLSISPIVEVVIAGVAFLLIPKKVFDFLEGEIDGDKKKVECNEREISELKQEFSDKIKRLQKVLVTISRTLHDMNSNERLMFKSKSTALIENLADSVCSKCSKCDKCWSRDFNTTYNALEKLIKSYENGKIEFPNELEKMCMYKFELIKDTERIVMNLNNKEILKERLGEGRELMANHVDNIYEAIGEMLMDFNKEISISEDFERVIRRALNKNGIQYRKIFCYRDSNSRTKIKLTMNKCIGERNCAKSVLPVLNSVMNRKMCVSEDGCTINPNTNECVVLFEESPRYNIETYAASAAKDGEKYSGDTFSFGKSKNGKYMNIISDGMGYGPEAGKESKATVDIIEDFIDAGFSKEAAINMINSIMTMKFEEDEKFSTLDLNLLDTYSGQISFVKVGAAASFIKRGKKIKAIVSNMPPFGVVDKVEVEEVKENVKGGDLVITLSDGILDINKESLGNYNWLEEFLVSATKEPKQLATDILEKAKELSGGKVKDDMTVIVSKVYSLY